MKNCKVCNTEFKKADRFIKASWSYVVTKRFSSKVEFITGLIPAWFVFTKLTYNDIKGGG